MSRTINFLVPHDTYGGHEKTALDLIAAACQNNYIPVVYLSNKQEIMRSELDQLGVSVKEFKTYSQFCEHYVGIFHLNFYKYVSQLRKIVCTKDPLIIVVGNLGSNHCFLLALQYVTKLLRRLSPIIFLPMLHNVQEMDLLGLRAILYKKRSALHLSRFSKFITIHKYWARRISSQNKNAVVCVQRNFIPSLANNEARRDFSPKKYCIVGRFDKQKGIDVLIDALALVKTRDFILEMIGDGPLLLGLMSSCVALGIDYNRHGWLSEENVSELMNASDLLIFPSRYEGIPLTIVHAINLKLPVLAFNVPGVNILLKAETLIQEVSPRGLAEKIDQYYSRRTGNAVPNIETNAYITQWSEYLSELKNTFQCVGL